MVVNHYEPKRQALKQIIHTKSLPLIVRIRAQHELLKFTSYSALNSINDRCIVGGRTRNIQMKLSPIVFRNYSLNGNIPGVRRSVW